MIKNKPPIAIRTVPRGFIFSRTAVIVMPTATRKRLAVEAARTFGWYQYVGLDGKVLGIDHFGASAPAQLVFEAFGLTVENVVKLAKEL